MNAGVVARQRLTCSQPGCPLKVHDYTREDLADLLVRFMAGEPRDEVAPDAKGYTVGENCRTCACNVMQGKQTFYSESEWQHLDELGQWHNRRHHRSRHRAGSRLTFFSLR